MPTHSLLRFRQDLRTVDNTALLSALEKSTTVTPIFILDTTLIDVFSLDSRFWFLLDALEQLDHQLQALWSNLNIYIGDPREIIPRLCATHKIATLHANRCYDRYGRKRDRDIAMILQDAGTDMLVYDDYLLVEPGAGEQRKVFTPYYKKQRLPRVQEHYTIISPQPFGSLSLPDSLTPQQARDQLAPPQNEYRPTDRETVLNRLASFSFASYNDNRNVPGLEWSTSRLSPYIRFWLLSIREVYNIARENDCDTYVSELARREFRYQVMHFFPETFDTEFQEKRRYIERENNPDHFAARCEWRTGYPIVDAAMKQLVTEKRMHGRTRMVVASFLTKDMLIDRRWGENFFKQHLLDYDEPVNIGNWQRSASVWADPKPLRIFSPIRQAVRFDTDCAYIHHCLPELVWKEKKAIHDPLSHMLSWYISPVIDHPTMAREAKERYNKSRDEFESTI